MEPVTDQNGNKGFYSEDKGFIPLSSMEKVTSPDGVKGYFHDSAGFIPEPSMKSQSAPQPQQPQDQGFFSRVGSAWGKRAENIGQELSAPTTANDFNPFLNERALRVAGQVAGGVGDVLSNAVTSAYKTLVPESSQQKFSEAGRQFFTETPVGQTIMGAGLTLGDKYKQFQENYPNLSKDIEAIANIAGVVPATKAIGSIPAVSAIGKAAKTGVKEAKNIPYMIQDAGALKNTLDTVIDEGINKGIRPTVKGKGTYGKMQKYDNSANEAVKDIINNRSTNSFERDGQIITGELPKNLGELSQVVENNMDLIVKKYTQIAGQSQVRFNPSKAGDVLNETINNRAIQVSRPDVAKFATELQERLNNAGEMTAIEYQELIKDMNTVAKKFYEKPETLSQGLVYETVARQMREDLAEGLGSAGKEYTGLRNMLKNYMAIEYDVNKRWQVDKGRNTFGLFDISNVATGAELAVALMKAGKGVVEPSSLLKSAAIYGTKKYMQYRNNPNTAIKNMFDTAERIMGVMKTDKPFNIPAYPKETQRIGYEPWKHRMVGDAFTPSAPYPNFTMKGQPFSGQSNMQRLIGAEERPLQIPYEFMPNYGVKTKTPVALDVSLPSKTFKNPFSDEKLEIALRTAPSLRTAEQKYMVDAITRRSK